MYLYPFNSFGFSEIAKTSKILPSSSFKRASLSSDNSSLTAGISTFTPPSNGFNSSVTTDSTGFTPPSNGFSSSVTTVSIGFTPPSNDFSSSVTTDSSGFTPPSNGFSSSVTTDSTGFTPPSNGFNSIVGTFSSDLDVITSLKISSSLSVCVVFPVFSSTVYIVVTFTFFPFSL